MSTPAPGEHPRNLQALWASGVPGQGGAGRVGAGRGTSPAGPAGEHPEPDSAMAILVERIAASLVSHEPGWRLPRASVLAQRHNVSADEVRTAIEQLVERQLVRRSPDGQVYRASPADYLVAVDGLAGLSAVVDPMGRRLTCLSYGMAEQAAPESAANALRVAPGAKLGVLRLTWALDDLPAALSTTYLTGHFAQPEALAAWLAATVDHGILPLAVPTEDLTAGQQRPRPRSVSIQMELPPAAVGKRLRLRTGQLGILVTVLTEGESGNEPAALTATVLRPDMFSVSLTSPTPAGRTAPWASEWSLAAVENGL